MKDIVELLEEHGSELSLRAARHIRIKWQTEDGLRKELRRMCELSCQSESAHTQEGQSK